MKKLSLLIVISMLILVAAGCGKQVFDGSSTANDSQFVLDYSVMNSTKTHDMELEEGTSIDVVIENDAGRLDIFITDSDGEKIYKGNNAASGKFSIGISKTDIYNFSVTGKKAKGSVSFKAVN